MSQFPLALLPSVTAVHPPETPVDQTEIRLTRSSRHIGWEALRESTFAAMRAAGVGLARLRRFAECGSKPIVLRSKTDPYEGKITRSTCHDRWCEPCQSDRACIIRRNLEILLDDPPYRFITLTLRSRAAGLREQVDDLIASYRRLRATRLWKNNTDRAIAVVELTRNEKTELWHPHLHILQHGKFIAHAALARTWERVSRGSMVVHLKLIRHNDAAIRYVTKYLTKSLAYVLQPSERALADAVAGLKGRRMLIGSGAWKNCQLLRNLEDEKWTYFGDERWTGILADKGDEFARTALLMIDLWRKQPAESLVFASRDDVTLDPWQPLPRPPPDPQLRLW